MDKYISTLNRIEPLANEDIVALNKLRQFASHLFLRKGEYLVSQGDIFDFEGYVNHGMLRQFLMDNNDNEKILRFHLEESFIFDMDSCHKQEPIEYSIQALEDCDLTIIKATDSCDIASQLPSYEKIAMKIMDCIIRDQQDHLSMLVKLAPEDRYVYLMKNNPELVQRLSITHLAQYIGITRETLSRIRRKICTT